MLLYLRKYNWCKIRCQIHYWVWGAIRVERWLPVLTIMLAVSCSDNSIGIQLFPAEPTFIGVKGVLGASGWKHACNGANMLAFLLGRQVISTSLVGEAGHVKGPPASWPGVEATLNMYPVAKVPFLWSITFCLTHCKWWKSVDSQCSTNSWCSFPESSRILTHLDFSSSTMRWKH